MATIHKKENGCFVSQEFHGTNKKYDSNMVPGSPDTSIL